CKPGYEYKEHTCKLKTCSNGLVPGKSQSGVSCPDSHSNADKCHVACNSDLTLTYTIETCDSGYVFKSGECKKIGSDCESGLSNVKESKYDDTGDCVVKECESGYKLKDANCNTRTGNCINADLPQFATAGVYNADGKCVATQCKDRTYLVVNASGVSQGWCVADVYCQSVKKLDANKVLNIIDNTKTDLSCVEKPTEVASGGSSASGGEVSGETSTGAAQSSGVTDANVFLSIIPQGDCAQEVLTKLNAVSGTRKRWDSPEGQYVTYCDIVCADGDIRQEKETFVEYQDGGDTIRTKQRYICVAGGDATSQVTGGNATSQSAPAKPDGTSCTPTDKNAKSGQYQNGECIIVECNGAYYKVSDDKKSCEEDKKAKSQAKIDELQKNADAMYDKEQSTANKLLGGAAIGATGIGAMQALSAYSEQQSDEDAETAMKAYLATFHCNYGGGINVKGGEKDVQLPGGNELIGLYAEYVNLANNLKVRKAALDMRPGIESEAILDSATSGLYDDVSIGKTSGAFTSLARALQNPDGPDAQAWAAQKDDSAKKLKTGLTVAGIGAIGGAVGNLLINKDAPKENSKEILDKYKDGYLVSGDDLDLNNGETRSLAEAVQPDAAVLDVKQDKTKSQDSVGVVMNKDD
ncbi:MAG: hypothetical protein II208_00120, partial [Alphaproteobacteria bacterium]|nr:hypothetical protein [Alphaproteobacteria bacterium]